MAKRNIDRTEPGDIMFAHPFDKWLYDLAVEVGEFNSQLRNKLQAYGEEDYQDWMDDIRIRLFASFPWPIGYEMQKLAVIEANQSHHRLNQILRITEKALQFVVHVMMIDLYDRNRQLAPSGKLLKFKANDFKSRFETTTIGNLVWLLQGQVNIYKENKIEPFLEGIIPRLSTPEFKKALEFVPPARNAVGHYRLDQNDWTLCNQIPDYLDKLFVILSAISVVCRYTLVSVHDIAIEYNRYTGPAYIHKCKTLNTRRIELPAKTSRLCQYIHSHCVAIVSNSDDVSAKYLDLSPLIFDTDSYVQGLINGYENERLRRTTKDIFIFTRLLRDDKLDYIGTRSTQEDYDRLDLTVLPFYDDLLNELKKLIESLAPVAA
jgi:hypothetical protein